MARSGFAAHADSLRRRRWSPGYGSAPRHGGERALPRPARVLRVAPLRIRADRLAELRRILGDHVEVTETTLTEPGAVEAIATSIVADVVVIDVVAPPVLPGLVAALAGYTLLRPRFEHIRTSHGERQPVFAGYAALTPEGGLEPLSDGALAISD